MAYVSQEDKKEMAPAIKAVLKKYGMKGSIGVRHHSTLVVTVKSGKLDVIGNYMKNCRHAEGRNEAPENIDVNLFWLDDHYKGEVLSFLKEMYSAMKGENYFDKSDMMTDYFHCSHYMSLNIGKWDKAYQLMEN
jgi:hypothetical protein